MEHGASPRTGWCNITLGNGPEQEGEVDHDDFSAMGSLLPRHEQRGFAEAYQGTQPGSRSGSLVLVGVGVCRAEFSSVLGCNVPAPMCLHRVSHGRGRANRGLDETSCFSGGGKVITFSRVQVVSLIYSSLV